MRGMMVLAIGAMMAGLASPAATQDGPVGIAIVVAPEQSSGVCFAGNLDRAMDCARQQCAEEGEGVRPGDCLRVQWCYPAGWSADIFYQLQEGFHGHDYLCGWASRELLVEAVNLKCDRERQPHIAECTMVRMWDNEGQLISREGGM
jgi:hypothetical protein